MVIVLDEFRDSDNKLIARNEKITVRLPNQIDSGIADLIGDLADGAADATGALISFSFIVNLVLGTSMNQLLTSLKFL